MVSGNLKRSLVTSGHLRPCMVGGFLEPASGGVVVFLFDSGVAGVVWLVVSKLVCCNIVRLWGLVASWLFLFDSTCRQRKTPPKRGPLLIRLNAFTVL